MKHNWSFLKVLCFSWSTLGDVLRLTSWCFNMRVNKYSFLITCNHLMRCNFGRAIFFLLNWNYSLFRSSKSHPGPIVHISDNPMDEGKVRYIWRLFTTLFFKWDFKKKKKKRGEVNPTAFKEGLSRWGQCWMHEGSLNQGVRLWKYEVKYRHEYRKHC